MIYDSFFGFTSEPFGVTPDPRIFFLSSTHEEALAHLKFGIKEDRGFIMLTGEAGSGKTTLMRRLIDSFGSDIHTSVILNPKAGPHDLLKMITSDFGISCDAENQAGMLKCLNEFLVGAFKKREKAVIFIDEAQDMGRDALEFIRLLSNIETDTKKLLQIVLMGQPELNDIVSSRSLRQLDQRIAVRYQIGPLKKDEVQEYIDHRLISAGSSITFPPGAAAKIYGYSGGIPRLINRACDRILLNAYAEGSRSIDKACVRRALEELSESCRSRRLSIAALMTGGFAMALVLVAVLLPSPAREDLKKMAQMPAVFSVDREGMITTADPAISRAASLLSLLKLWGENDISLSAAGADDLIMEKGYSIYTAGSLDDLKHLDLPAVLGYKTREGTRYVVLTWIIGDDAVVFDPLSGRTLKPLQDLPKDLSEIVILWRNKYNKADWISFMQKRLSEIGILKGYSSGVLDKKTEAAIMRFQKTSNVRVTGRPDEETLILLSKDSLSPILYPEEIRHGNTRQIGQN